jgi:hypothetical protein
MPFNRIGSFLFLLICFTGCEDGGNADSSVGQGGSLTRFAISGNHLYTVSNTTIGVYNIAANDFTHVRDVAVGGGLETIFVNGQHLYLGARSAMHIYSIADPTNPQFVFQYSHIVSCDPVVVQGNRAYVTMKSGTACNLGTNALEILDISNPNDPELLANYPMTSPGGLGISGSCLFICEGEHGLKLLDVSNPQNIELKKELTDINAYDVIVSDGFLTLTGEDGIFQYQFNCQDYSLTQLSKIPVVREEL